MPFDLIVFMTIKSIDTLIDFSSLSDTSRTGPLKKTHIMQKVNVNSKTFKEYVEFLIKQGLVEERPVKEERIVYEITPRGVLVLKGLKEMEKLILPPDSELVHG